MTPKEAKIVMEKYYQRRSGEIAVRPTYKERQQAGNNGSNAMSGKQVNETVNSKLNLWAKLKSWWKP